MTDPTRSKLTARELARRGLAALRVIYPLAFPLLALAGTRLLGARAAALVLLALAVPALLSDLGRGLERGALLAGVTAALLATAALLDDDRFLLVYPSLVSSAFLVQFAASLRGERPIVETFARLQVADLTPTEVAYCRSVTKVWCVFFAANAATAALLAGLAPRGIWAAYTGAISYALITLLFAVEYVVRKARFGRFGRGPVDRLLAAVLARATEPSR